jgi:hypothetical protein
LTADGWRALVPIGKHGDPVLYSIAFYKFGEKLGNSSWDGTLDKAK